VDIDEQSKAVVRANQVYTHTESGVLRLIITDPDELGFVTAMFLDDGFLKDGLRPRELAGKTYTIHMREFLKQWMVRVA